MRRLAGIGWRLRVAGVYLLRGLVTVGACYAGRTPPPPWPPLVPPRDRAERALWAQLDEVRKLLPLLAGAEPDRAEPVRRELEG